MQIITIWAKTTEDMVGIGTRIGRHLPRGCVLCLVGDLGAGKTTLTQGIAHGLGVTQPVTSPTFTIVNEYEGRQRLYHIDTYRIPQSDALLEIGIEEYLPSDDGITVIEWPEVLEKYIPEESLWIEIITIEGAIRQLTLSAPEDWMDWETITKELSTYEYFGH